MTLEEFRADIRGGIPATIPPAREYDGTVNHAPRRKHIPKCFHSGVLP